MVGVRETPVAPFAGRVEVIASGTIGAGGANTVKALLKVAVCAPVATVTVRAPVAAAGSIVIVAVAVVGVATVTEPCWPSEAPATLIPAPKLASVWPWTKFVPLKATVRTCPALAELGLTELIPGVVVMGAACAAIVTVFDVTPPIEIVTGTALPVLDVEGTCAFT